MPAVRTREGGRDQSAVKHRPFSELHYKDQQLKQTKKLCIEQNWQCTIDECLPPAIRPRVEIKKGAKARVDDKGVHEEKWWNWSVELLKSLEELSSMTEGELEYARQLLEIEVEHRQNNPKSSQRKILEVLLGDAQRVVDEQRKRLAIRYTSDVMEQSGESMDPQYDHLGFPQTRPLSAIQYDDDQDNVGGSQSLVRASTRNGVDGGTHRIAPQSMLATKPHHSSAAAPQASSGRQEGPSESDSPGDVRAHLAATELKARAARLRARAMRAEAEAAEIEAEARELQSDMGTADR